ncbi:MULTISPECIES: winged helix-turn-helix domain-containing protein [Sphingobium]|uniref:winged helix-turn-helix domain-containing protein n=1 Tax=Sphingobium sp. MI1205 TaxID=407020 RepID=UPI000770348B|nr:LysR family transcriptional regulator [Sphingobium sp. MI1205]AMK18665.1 putative ModE family transcriptional regulator [Sphingobium sp. MI1205]
MSGPRLKIKTQIYCGDEIAMGPGKADLLDAIASEGSISAAGRKLKMSYRRCWMLVDVMNRCWAGPLVATSSEGALVTELGQQVLAQYRGLQMATASAAGQTHWPDLAQQVRGEPLPPRS